MLSLAGSMRAAQSWSRHGLSVAVRYEPCTQKTTYSEPTSCMKQYEKKIHTTQMPPAAQRHTAVTAIENPSLDTAHAQHDLHKLKPFKEMPGPKGLPLVGTLWDYVKKDGLHFNQMFKIMQARSSVYGPVYKERIGNNCSVVVSDPEEYAKVIRVDGRFPHRIELMPMVHYRQKRGMTLGTVNSQGEEWYRHRSVLSQKMLRPKEVQDYACSQSDVGTDFMHHLKSVLTDDGRVAEFEREVFKCALESICVVLFEERVGCFPNPPTKQAQDFISHLIGFFKYMQPLIYNVPMYKLYPTATWRMYEKHADAVISIAQDFVNKKVQALQRQAQQNVAEDEVVEKSEFLTYLLTQKSLSPEEANSHAVDLMMGAVETTANATIWTLYCLAKFPAAQARLQQEVDGVLSNRQQITPDILANLPYVKACLKETFRMYPITFATSRIIAEDIELAGYHVPKGANLYGMGHDPTLFPDPETYQPERWLRGDKEGGASKALASLPWGHGARMCIGRRFAEQEIYIALTKLMQTFSVEHEETLEPVLNTVMTPDRPVNFRFLLRAPATDNSVQDSFLDEESIKIF